MYCAYSSQWSSSISCPWSMHMARQLVQRLSLGTDRIYSTGTVRCICTVPAHPHGAPALGSHGPCIWSSCIGCKSGIHRCICPLPAHPNAAPALASHGPCIWSSYIGCRVQTHSRTNALAYKRTGLHNYFSLHRNFSVNTHKSGFDSVCTALLP